MKNIIYISIVFQLFLYTNSFSQIVCVSGGNFKINEFALRAGVQTSILVKLDIENFKPKNIKINFPDSLDKFITEKFISDTRYNLNQITFLKDTLNYKLKIHYIIFPSRKISNSYAELINDEEIKLVFKSHGLQKYNEEVYEFIDSDSLTFTSYIDYESGKAVKTDILVERVFSTSNDTTIIIRNNYPVLTETILSLSKEYSTKNFIDIKPNSKKYFIRFYLRRNILQCDYDEIF